jgi:hypothetical protein
MSTTISSIEKQIARIQRALAALGPMRPGTLNRQYKDPAKKQGGYWQISYTHKMRSRSEYVRAEHLRAVRTELANFRKFRTLAERWIDLSLELSRLKRKPTSPDKA